MGDVEMANYQSSGLDLSTAQEKLGQKNHMDPHYRYAVIPAKSSIFEVFSAGVFKVLQFEDRFQKAPFSFSVDGRPSGRNKAAFFSSVE